MTKQDLEKCIDAYGRDLYAFCRHLAGSGQEADELYQDTSAYQHKANGTVRSDRTYCAVAIEREDGSEFGAEHGEFFVSPLIGGLDPSRYNAATLCGSYGEFVEEGILYRLLECENISYFADRELYLCVTDTGFYDNRLYQYDEESGSLSRNEQYEGLNALFALKLDAALADPARAQALLDNIEAGMEAEAPEGEQVQAPKAAEEAMAWAAQITPENIGRYCVRLEHTVQTVSVDADGSAEWGPWSVRENGPEVWGGGGGSVNAEWYFEGRTGMRIHDYSSSERGMQDLVITTLTLNEDGTVTFAAWRPKDVSGAATPQ